MPELISSPIVLMLWAAIGYGLGSIPSGVLIARFMGLGNLRDIGSGNIGATNVLRTGNKTAAILTLLFDAFKGIVAVLVARTLAAEDAAQVAGLAAFIGHCFPVWLKFRGGKGVATYFGILIALSPFIAAVAAVIWLVVAAVSRYSSLAALVTAGWTPVVMAFTDHGEMFILGIVLAILIYIRHAANIKRLRRREETKIGAK